MPPERWRTTIVLLTMAATVVVSIVAGLQADSDIRADVANRESQYYAIRASGELFRESTRSDYDLATFASATHDMQQSLVHGMTALEQESSGESAIAESARALEAAAAARAGRLRALSVFYTDPAYAPASPDGMPDLQGYMEASFAPVNELVAVQNEAADAYQRWSRKSDGYVAVLALMAVALFLFGLAQAANVRTRRTFTTFGIMVSGAATLWAIAIAVG